MSASTSAATLAAAPALQLRPISLLTLGHLLVDLCQGLVPALVPYLVTHNGYSYAAAAGLVFAASALSSVVQPVFGGLADRGSIPHLLPLSVLLAGCALGIGSQLQYYPVLLLAFAASGVGIAAFHPEAARRTFLAAGPSRTTAMSYFSLGGSIGFAMAPMLGAALLASFSSSIVFRISICNGSHAGGCFAGAVRSEGCAVDAATLRRGCSVAGLGIQPSSGRPGECPTSR